MPRAWNRNGFSDVKEALHNFFLLYSTSNKTNVCISNGIRKNKQRFIFEFYVRSVSIFFINVNKEG